MDKSEMAAKGAIAVLRFQAERLRHVVDQPEIAEHVWKAAAMLEEALASAPQPPSGGEVVDQPPKGWSPCRRCNRPDPACQRKDCDRCGGSGWRKKCNALDCIEYGCNGYGFCLVTPEEVTAALSAPQPPSGGEVVA